MKIIFTLIVLFFSVELIAQKAGTLDKSFGVNGEVVTSFNNASVTVYKGLIQPDNKIIAVGEYNSLSSEPVINGFFAVRYMPDGSIDSSFADNGKAIINDTAYVVTPSSACLQNDGKILIAGLGVDGMFDPVYAGIIVRLNVDGSIDSTFGQNGFVYTANTAYNAIAIQTDGKIICVGANFVSRLLENGSTDPSFGTNGYLYIGDINPRTCKIQPDGKILVGGSYNSCCGLPLEFFLERLEVNGSPDSSFGSAGATITQVGSYSSFITDLALQSDGKIVALGLTGNGYSTATARYTIDGNLDSTFANNGISQDYFPGTFGLASSVVIQNDNKILLGGNAVENNKGDYGIERLTQNGLRDSSFGENGLVTTDFADYSGSNIASLGLQASGKIVAIGKSVDANYDYYVSLARYDNDDKTKKQIIVQKIKQYLQTHNDAQATTLNNVSIYPNPAQNILHIEGLSSSQKTKLTIVDFNGNIAISQQLPANSSSYNLNIASLHAGNYILKIETNGEVVTKQFVKE